MLKSDSTLELIKKKGKKKQLISCFVFFLLLLISFSYTDRGVSFLD